MMLSYLLISKIKKLKKNSSNGNIIVLLFIYKTFRGLTDANLKFMKFRFNQSFHLISADNFLKDLFNDKTVQSLFEPIRDQAGG